MLRLAHHIDRMYRDHTSEGKKMFNKVRLFKHIDHQSTWHDGRASREARNSGTRIRSGKNLVGATWLVDYGDAEEGVV